MGYEYRRNEAIIRSKTREFFGVGTVVTASAYLVSVVDFMLIGVLLGADSVAAAGLGDSFVDVAELFGFVLLQCRQCAFRLSQITVNSAVIL